MSPLMNFIKGAVLVLWCFIVICTNSKKIPNSDYKKLKNSFYIKSIWPKDYERIWIKSLVGKITREIRPYSATIWSADDSMSTNKLSDSCTANFQNTFQHSRLVSRK